MTITEIFARKVAEGVLAVIFAMIAIPARKIRPGMIVLVPIPPARRLIALAEPALCAAVLGLIWIIAAAGEHLARPAPLVLNAVRRIHA